MTEATVLERNAGPEALLRQQLRLAPADRVVCVSAVLPLIFSALADANICSVPPVHGMNHHKMADGKIVGFGFVSEKIWKATQGLGEMDARGDARREGQIIAFMGQMRPQKKN